MRENRDHLRSLVAKLCDEELSQQDRDDLNDLLRESPALRREYASLMEVHANLITHSGLPEPDTTLPKSRNQMFVPLAIMGALSLVLLLILPLTEKTEPAPGFVSVIRADDCDWTGRSHPVEGALLGKSKLHLNSGTAVLRFPGGVEITLAGPAELEIKNSVSAILHEGQLYFTNSMAEDETGFTLLTPRGEVLDIGTSYSLKVSPEGSEEIHVDDGMVIRLGDEGGKSTVNAGEAMRWESRGASRSIPFVKKSAYIRAERRAERGKPIAWYSFADQEGYGFTENWAAWGDSEEEGRSIRSEFTSQGFQPAEHAVIAARLKVPIDLREDGVTYFSLQGRIEDAPISQRKFYFAFRESNNPDHKALFTMNTKRRTMGAHLLHSDQDIEGRSNMALALPANGRRFQLAGKIISRADEPDQVFLRVIPEDEPLDVDEPFAWSVVGKRVYTDFRIDLVTLHLGANGQISISDLNFGKTWQSATRPLRK